MGREHLETKEDCDRFLDRNEANLATLTRKRSDLYNGIRRCTKEETRRAVKAEIHAVSKEISPHLRIASGRGGNRSRNRAGCIGTRQRNHNRYLSASL